MGCPPPKATHFNGAYFLRKAQGGAYFWCSREQQWRYMEDKSARKALKTAVRLEGENK